MSQPKQFPLLPCKLELPVLLQAAACKVLWVHLLQHSRGLNFTGTDSCWVKFTVLNCALAVSLPGR